MAKQIEDQQKSWYVLHTYSGYEDNVARNLRQRIESMNMQDKIFEVMVPKENRIKIRNGKRYTIRERIFPGYVLVNMIVTDESWYVVRNTPNVTGFIGIGTTPTPVNPDEILRVKKKTGTQEAKFKINVNKGDMVKIVDGPFKNFEGKVEEVDEQKGKVTVLVSVFGRGTPAELDFLQIKKA